MSTNNHTPAPASVPEKIWPRADILVTRGSGGDVWVYTGEHIYFRPLVLTPDQADALADALRAHAAAARKRGGE